MCDHYPVPGGQGERLEGEGLLLEVGEVRFIDAVLCNLALQGFMNVLLVGRQTEALQNYLDGSFYAGMMNITVFLTYGESVGDALRELESTGLELTDAIVMNACTYTNVDLNTLLKAHRQTRPRNIATVFLLEDTLPRSDVHAYGTVGRDLVYYQEIGAGGIDTDEVFGLLDYHPTISMNMNGCPPSVAVLSDMAFAIMADNFDYQSIGDLLAGVLACKLYDNKIQVFGEWDLWEVNCPRPGNDTAREDRLILHPEGDTEPARPSLIYYREVLTEKDRRTFSEEWKNNAFGTNAEQITAMVKQMHKYESNAQRVLGKNTVSKFRSGYIDIYMYAEDLPLGSPGEHIAPPAPSPLDLYLLPSSIEIQIDDSSDSEASHGQPNDTFFDNIFCLLHRHVTTAGFYDKDMADVYKQISLLRIVWNASKIEIIEAFGFFLIDMLDTENLEESISKASVFFSVLRNFIDDREDEELLLDSIYSSMPNMQADLKARVLFNYGFLFIEDDIIDKSVIRKYNKLYKAGKF